MSMMILTLKFLIMCTIIGATFGNPLDEEKNKVCSVASSHFNAYADAELLHTAAMEGQETNVRLALEMLPKRNNEQRESIAQEQIRVFKEGIKRVFRYIAKKLSESFPTDYNVPYILALAASKTPLHEFYANELYNAMRGPGTSEDVLIEVLVPLSNYDIDMVSRSYKEIYLHELGDDLKRETSRHFERFLVTLSAASKNPNTNVDVVDAIADARKLYNAGEARWGTDEKTFNKILLENSIPQLRRIFEEYKKISHRSIEVVITREFSWWTKAGYLAVVQCARDETVYFAKELHSAITNRSLWNVYRKITRIIVGRLRIDIHDINRTYQRLYGKSIASDLIAHREMGKYRNYICLLLEFLSL